MVTVDILVDLEALVQGCRGWGSKRIALDPVSNSEESSKLDSSERGSRSRGEWDFITAVPAIGV